MPYEEYHTHLQTIAHMVSDIMIWKDAQGRWIDVNKQTLELFQLDEQLYKGKTDAELVHIYPHYEQTAQKCILAEQITWDAGQQMEFEEIIVLHGTEYIFEIKKIPFYKQDGSPAALCTLGRDVTEKKRLEMIRDTQAEILKMIALGEPLSDIFYTIIEMVEEQSSEAFCSLMLYEPENNWLRVDYAPHLPKEYIEQIDKLPIGLLQGSCGHAAYTKETTIVSNIATDPSWRKWKNIAMHYGLRSCFSIPIVSTKGALLGTFAMYSMRAREPEAFEMDMWRAFSYLVGLALERRQQEQDIHYLAFYDALTGLPNLQCLRDSFQRAIQPKQKNKLAIMLLDLDHFKPINDTFGHPFGDSVLQEVAKRLQGVIPKEDIVSRMGGDEFVFLLHNILDEATVCAIADQILQVLEQPILLGGRELYVNASIGMSLYPLHGNTIDALISNADTAMYYVKRNGKSGKQVYHKAMSEQTTEQFLLQGEFRKALKQQQFLLYYQPKINIETETIIGLEALIRWKHPYKGLISPATFIPLAEENGYILELGAWVLREACEQIKRWREIGFPDIPVAVNVSIKQLMQQDVVTLVKRTISEMNIPASLLEIEITESVLAQHEYLVQNAVEGLQNIGVQVAIDDFGTGYASLTYLKKFEANTIKIDRSFIRSLPQNKDDAAITSAVIALANQLEMSIVAEGVETKEQVDFLRSKGCSYVQGYYYSPPLPAAELIRFLETFQTK